MTSKDNGNKTEAKPAPAKPKTEPVKTKPEGPPNVTVRTYAEVIVNKKGTEKK